MNLPLRGNTLRYLLDSVILIDHFNGISAATAFLREQHTACAISAITRAEVLTGFAAAACEPARLFLNAFPCLPVDAVIADQAAVLRREQRWKLPDAIQASLAQQHGLRLVTRNIRDFPESLGFVLMPYAWPA